MSSQLSRQTKVVVLSLDGFIFNLDKFRYNYYKNACKEEGLTISKEEFHNELSSMHTMYKNLPLADIYEPFLFNTTVESELFQYLQSKGLEERKGVQEVISYFHQKDIAVVAFTTHKTKDAKAYLKLAQLDSQIDYIVGSNQSYLPLPSTQSLETVAQNFDVNYNQVLVVSTFYQLNLAASKLLMPVIFFEDLIPATSSEKETSTKIISDPLEIIQFLMIDSYDETNMYSSILGFNKNMNAQELLQKKEALEKSFEDDEEIIPLVEQTYSYHLNELLAEHRNITKDTSRNAKRFTFNDDVEHLPIQEDEEIIEEENEILEVVEEPKEETPIVDSVQTLEIEKDPYQEQLDTELKSLLSQINKSNAKRSEIKDNNDISIEKYEEDTEEENNSHISVFTVLSEIIYILSLSLLILLLGLIGYTALVHLFNNNGFFQFIAKPFIFYINFIQGFFEIVLNALHTLIKTIPDYATYHNHNTYVSPTGVEFLNIFIFNSLVIAIVKIVNHFIKRGSDNEVF